MRYNLLSERWIRVIRENGEPQRVSTREALSDPGHLLCITEANPLDLFAVHRFLLTLLYWKAEVGGGVPAVRESLLAGRMPTQVVAAIEDDRECFDLLSAERPFLQDPAVRRNKPTSAGYLFAEFSCGTNIAHFHHGDDKDMRLCLPCAASGMLRLVPWTQSGGSGKSPAIHNAPPIMALAVGENLAVTLGLNLVPLAGEAGVPKWSGHFSPTNPAEPVPYLEAFTWNPRRVHVLEPQSGGSCWRCGAAGVPVVGPIVYVKNQHTKSKKSGKKSVPFTWQDPAAFYTAEAPYTTIKSYDEGMAATGRDLGRLIAEDAEPAEGAVVTANPNHRRWRLVVPSTNPAHNKTFDNREVETRGLSADVIAALVPPAGRIPRQQAVDGWKEPERLGPIRGATALVGTAVRLFTDADWAVLAAAAYRKIQESPAAFGLLSGLLWALRKKQLSGLPTPDTAWLVLKLMASVPREARVLRRGGGFSPIDRVPKRQVPERRGDRRAVSPYPAAFPSRDRLEAALRDVLDGHLRKRVRVPIDWPGLCRCLNRLLD